MDLSGSNKDTYRYITKKDLSISDLLEKNRIESNLFVIRAMVVLAVVNLFYFVFSLIALENSNMLDTILLIVNVVLLIGSSIVCRFKIDATWMRYCLLSIIIVSSCLAQASFSVITVFYFAIPIVLSCRYYDEKLTITISAISILAGLIVIILSGIIEFNKGYVEIGLINVDGPVNLWIEEAIGKSIISASWFDKPQYFADYIIFYGFVFILLITPLSIICYETSKSGKFLLKEEASIQSEKDTVLKDLQESKMEIMISQIQPHFLYNALNSIYYLVDKDTKKAKRAIADFSDYLRANLNFSKSSGLVPFSQEMEHINRYLALEKLRFEDTLNIIYKLSVQCFRVPSLAIQPLVENAVKHGINKKNDGGTLTISTIEEDQHYVIKIIDNGVGYDTTKPFSDNRRHIGLENSKYRLETMCNAIFYIESEIGKGTTVTIKIPKEFYYEDNSR